ncbi:hypothetical protein DWX81_15315 [Roseburia inulinivorans]|nr:hypothetical protein DWX81_15315 [Roseburia inulinivorans]
MIEAYEKIISNIQEDDLAVTRCTLRKSDKAIELSNCQKEKMIEAYEKIISNIQEDDLAVTRCTLRKIRQLTRCTLRKIRQLMEEIK